MTFQSRLLFEDALSLIRSDEAQNCLMTLVSCLVVSFLKYSHVSPTVDLAACIDMVFNLISIRLQLSEI